jgi:hypothetical protein
MNLLVVDPGVTEEVRAEALDPVRDPAGRPRHATRATIEPTPMMTPSIVRTARRRAAASREIAS